MIRSLIPLFAIAACAAVESVPALLVAPFDNLSGRVENIAIDDRLPADPNTVQVVVGDKPQPRERKVVRDRLAETARDVIEDVVVNLPGAKVVERTQADGLFAPDGGRVREPVEALRAAKGTGANLVLLGSIARVSSDRDSTTAEVRVRLVNGEGTVIFSQVVQGSVPNGSDAPTIAVRDALRSLRDSQDFRALVAPLPVGAAAPAQGTVEVLIQPTESNCEIVVDGLLVGNTPRRIPLPIGKPVRLRIAKTGFAPWERVVSASPGLRLTPELVRSP